MAAVGRAYNFVVLARLFADCGRCSHGYEQEEVLVNLNLFRKSSRYIYMSFGWKPVKVCHVILSTAFYYIDLIS